MDVNQETHNWHIALQSNAYHISIMSFALPTLVVVAMVATLGALGLGLTAMVKGGAFNAKYSNKLMRLRVILQFSAIVLLGLIFLFSTR